MNDDFRDDHPDDDSEGAPIDPPSPEEAARDVNADADREAAAGQSEEESPGEEIHDAEPEASDEAPADGGADDAPGEAPEEPAADSLTASSEESGDASLLESRPIEWTGRYEPHEVSERLDPETEHHLTDTLVELCKEIEELEEEKKTVSSEIGAKIKAKKARLSQIADELRAGTHTTTRTFEIHIDWTSGIAQLRYPRHGDQLGDIYQTRPLSELERQQQLQLDEDRHPDDQEGLPATQQELAVGVRGYHVGVGLGTITKVGPDSIGFLPEMVEWRTGGEGPVVMSRSEFVDAFTFGDGPAMRVRCNACRWNWPLMSAEPTACPQCHTRAISTYYEAATLQQLRETLEGAMKEHPSVDDLQLWSQVERDQSLKWALGVVAKKRDRHLSIDEEPPVITRWRVRQQMAAELARPTRRYRVGHERWRGESLYIEEYADRVELRLGRTKYHFRICDAPADLTPQRLEGACLGMMDMIDQMKAAGSYSVDERDLVPDEELVAPVPPATTGVTAVGDLPQRERVPMDPWKASGYHIETYPDRTLVRWKWSRATTVVDAPADAEAIKRACIELDEILDPSAGASTAELFEEDHEVRKLFDPTYRGRGKKTSTGADEAPAKKAPSRRGRPKKGEKG